MAYQRRQSQHQIKSEKTQSGVAAAIIVLLMLALLAGAALVMAQWFTTSEEAPEEEASSLETFTLIAETYSQHAELYGQLESTTTALVYPQADGTVVAVYVEEGDEVKANQQLFKLENETLTNNVQTTKTNLASARASYQSAVAAQETCLSKLNKAEKKLAKAQATLAQAQAEAEEGQTVTADLSGYEAAVDSASDAYEIATTAVENALVSVNSCKQAYKTAKAQAKLLTVRASMAGTVASLEVEVGASVAELNAAGASVKIVDLSAMQAVLQLPEDLLGQVEEGTRIKLTSEENANFNMTGTVLEVATEPTSAASLPDALSAATGNYYALTLSLPQTSTAMVDGLALTGSFTAAEYEQVFYVPKAAVGEVDGKTYIQSETEQYKVNIVDETDEQYIVTSKAEAGAVILAVFGSAEEEAASE